MPERSPRTSTALGERDIAGISSRRLSTRRSTSDSDTKVNRINSINSLHKDIHAEETNSLDKSRHVTCSRTRISQEMIHKALREMKPNKWVTAKDISEYLWNQGIITKSTRCPQIAIALARGGQRGVFVKSSDGKRYKTKSRSPSKTKPKPKPKTGGNSITSAGNSRKNTSKTRVAERRKRTSKSSSSVVVNEHKIQKVASKKLWLKRMINSLDPRKMMESVTSPSPMSMVKVGGVSIPALIDTGAVLSMMSPDAYKEVKDICPLITQKEAPILRMINSRAANNSPIPIRGLIVADVTVGQQKVKDAFIVVMKHQRPPPTFIVGMNIIKHIKTNTTTPS